ncbi:MAG TPA: hypothetical protein VF032_05395 [Thermoleophilaceae bacterium]
MYTGGPAARVRALLELCRAAVDEIVLAVDRNGDPEMVEACAGIADRTVMVGSHMIERVLGWMMLQCSGAWIFRLDGDEIPSPELLRALPEFANDRFPVCIQVPRRWLYPDARSYIVAAPWQPDYQVRIVRNIPGLWRLPGIAHSSVELPGDHHLTDLPLYHADLVVNPREQREAKAAEYEQRRPGHNFDGFSVNEMYVPERHQPETAAVPANALQSIERVLAGATWRKQRWRRPSVSAADDDALRGLDETRTVDVADLHAGVAWANPPTTLKAGTKTNHLLVVENRGREWWPRADGLPEIRIGYRFFDPAADEVRAEGRGTFTETVRAGHTTRLMVPLAAPDAPGEYLLEVGLVLEHVQWCETDRRTITVER